MKSGLSHPLCIAAAFYLLATSGQGVHAAETRPNVLFIICDDLNCDLGCYGHPLVKSPHIDRLAQQGLRFNRAYCQYPLCGPSRASFMAGLYPDQTLIHRNAVYLRHHVPNVITWSQLFRQNGYFAARIGKIFHYGVPRHIGTSGHDDPDSWDYTINPRGRDKDEEHLIFSLVPGSFGGTLSWLAADGTDEQQTDGIAAGDAAALLRQYAASGRSFFLAVGFYRPHTPYVSPKRYFDLYAAGDITVPTVPEGYLDTLPEPARRSISRKKDHRDLPDALARRVIQAYHASITFVDAQVGRVLQTLRETGLDENTIVVLTSDHGYHMGEHGHWQKTTLFENAARVPLIIRVPGMATAGRSTDAPTEMLDLYPTVARLCGLEPPPYLSGVDLRPVLSDAAARPRDSALTQYDNGYSVRTARYRYTEWGDAGQAGRELYDHEHDPDELANLAGDGEYASVTDELRDLLHQRIQDAREAPAGVVQRRYEVIDSRR